MKHTATHGEQGVSATTINPGGSVQISFPCGYVTAHAYNKSVGLELSIHVDELTLQAIIDTATRHIAERHEDEALLIDSGSEL